MLLLLECQWPLMPAVLLPMKLRDLPKPESIWHHHGNRVWETTVREYRKRLNGYDEIESNEMNQSENFLHEMQLLPRCSVSMVTFLSGCNESIIARGWSVAPVLIPLAHAMHRSRWLVTTEHSQEGNFPIRMSFLFPSFNLAPPPPPPPPKKNMYNSFLSSESLECISFLLH